MAPTISIMTSGKCAFVWTAAGSQHSVTLKLTDKVTVFNPTLLSTGDLEETEIGGIQDQPRWATFRGDAKMNLFE